MLEITERTYRCRCETCGHEQIWVVGKYAPVTGPFTHYKGIGWILEANGGMRTYCSKKCREGKE